MNQIILDTLEEFQDSQINLASLTARQILANKLEENLEQYVSNLVEEAVSVIEGLSK
jgi:vacuolar-type H+-ATPase subunit E/Vma4|tara:strand:- start:455 stop:625 length:171 start_codon:yes stop_codon:yes gene_type:complete